MGKSLYALGGTIFFGIVCDRMRAFIQHLIGVRASERVFFLLD